MAIRKKKWSWAWGKRNLNLQLTEKQQLVSRELQKHHLNTLNAWTCDTVMRHWSTGTLLIDHNTDFSYRVKTDCIYLGHQASKCNISHPLTWTGRHTEGQFWHKTSWMHIVDSDFSLGNLALKFRLLLHYMHKQH